MIIYAQDLEGMQKFYRHVFDFEVREAHYSMRTSNYVRLRRDKTEFLLVQVEVSDIENNEKIKLKASIHPKPVFWIEESMADCRERTIKNGGSFDPDHKEWTDLGYQVCEGTDIEGNVFQVRTEKVGF
jgi:predicted enzyme related to lactoylglutathione lyase